MNVSKQEALLSLAPLFRHSNAETEATTLSAYFVKTDAWQQLDSGEVSVVRGPKGSGKSALYALLLRRGDVSFPDTKERVVVVKAEEPLGASVFLDALGDRLQTATQQGTRDFLMSEAEFLQLWKWYFLALIGATLQNAAAVTPRLKEHAGYRELIKVLTYWHMPTEDAQPRLRRVLEFVMKYVTLRFQLNLPPAQVLLELGYPPDGASNTKAQAKTEPEPSLTELFALADAALGTAGLIVWLALDRLDEAFAAHTSALEANGLRGLLRAFNDLLGFSHIKLKIFVRDDVFQRVTLTGRPFPGLNLVGPEVDLSWRTEELLDLIMRRMLQSESVQVLYHLDVEQLESLQGDYATQLSLFKRIFPPYIDGVESLEWMLSTLRDGACRVAPRNVLRLINHSVQNQMSRHLYPNGEVLFDSSVVREASKQASHDHYVTAFLAEYPKLRDFAEALTGHREGYPFPALYNLWRKKRHNLREDTAHEHAMELVRVGFFTRQVRDQRHEVFRAAPLYRAALGLIPGDLV